MVSARHLVSFAVSVPLFVFDISVTVCIAQRRLRDNSAFQSAFYLVYIHTSIIDVISYVSVGFALLRF